MRHFTKAWTGMPLFDSAGRRIPSVAITNDLHSISTDDPAALSALDRFIRENIAGVQEVSAAELEDIKKKAAGSPTSKPDEFRLHSVAPDTLSPSVPPAAAVPVGSSMRPVAEEVAELRQHQAEARAAEPAPKPGKPTSTPPSVGKRNR